MRPTSLLIAGFALAAASASMAAHQEAPVPHASVSQDVAACIAIVLPSVQGVDGSASDVGAALRDLFASFLNGPALRVVPLDSRLATHAFEEARQKDCARVLTMTLVRKRKGGGLLTTVMGQAGSSVAWGIPGGNVTAAVTRGALAAAGQAVTDMAASTREKDELTLDYTVSSVRARPVFGPRREKAKAKSDGEDLVTPMVEKAATAIAAAVLAR